MFFQALPERTLIWVKYDPIGRRGEKVITTMYIQRFHPDLEIGSNLLNTL